MKRADRCGARFAMFVGEDELRDGRYGFKDLASGEQVDLDEHSIVRRLTERSGGE